MSLAIDPMTMETGAAALLFGATFVFGSRVHPLRSVIHDRRSIVSFGAGMTAAYVFVHVMPELHEAREVLASMESVATPKHGLVAYFVALLGFVVFFSLDRLRLMASGAEAELEKAEAASFRFHIGGFAAYVALMSGLLVRGLGETSELAALFAMVIAFHFLAVDHDMGTEYGERYRHIGRFVLAGAAILGWAAASLVPLPSPVIALLVAFISGAIVVNSLVMELGSEKEGKMLPFLAGSAAYGLLLWLIG